MTDRAASPDFAAWPMSHPHGNLELGAKTLTHERQPKMVHTDERSFIQLAMLLNRESKSWMFRKGSQLTSEEAMLMLKMTGHRIRRETSTNALEYSYNRAKSWFPSYFRVTQEADGWTSLTDARCVAIIEATRSVLADMHEWPGMLEFLKGHTGGDIGKSRRGWNCAHQKLVLMLDAECESLDRQVMEGVPCESAAA